MPSEDLEEADVVGAEVVPIIMLGLFNPAGPTAVTVTALSNTKAGSSDLVVTC